MTFKTIAKFLTKLTAVALALVLVTHTNYYHSTHSVRTLSNPISKVKNEGGHLVTVIQFDTEVNGESVDETIKLIDGANENGAEHIVIVFDTPGGSVMDGFKLSAAIENSKAPIACVVNGFAASMGAFLLQSCSERYMTKSSLLMFHEAATDASGKSGDLEKQANLLRHLDRALAEHEVRRMHITVEDFLKKVHGYDWWMNWDEALELGAIDAVMDSTSQLVKSLEIHGTYVPT